MLTSVILLLLLLGFIAQGWKDGLIQTAGRVIGGMIGFLVARSWSIGIAFIFEILLPASWSRLIAFLVIFVFITHLVGIIFKLADKFFRIITILPLIKSVNSLVGSILGFIEGLITLGGTIWVITSFSLIPSLVDLLKASSVAQAILAVFNVLISWTS